jgi:hypothetical protein
MFFVSSIQSNLPIRICFWTGDLTRIIKALERTGHKCTTILRIVLSYLVTALIPKSASITIINYSRSTSLWAGLTVTSSHHQLQITILSRHGFFFFFHGFFVHSAISFVRLVGWISWK